MAKRKKVSRKELLNTEDEFLSVSHKLLNFVMTHQNRIYTGLGVVMALILAISGFRYYQNQTEAQAFTRLGEATRAYAAATQGEPDFKAAYAAVEGDFDAILKDYAGKSAAKFASMTYADICYRAGVLDQAIDLYQQALGGFQTEPFYKYRILSSLGYTHMEMKDFEKAAEYFQTIADQPDAPARDEALFQLAGIYTALGQKEKSLSAYERIVADFSDSIYIKIAQESIAG